MQFILTLDDHAADIIELYSNEFSVCGIGWCVLPVQRCTTHCYVVLKPYLYAGACMCDRRKGSRSRWTLYQ